MLSVASVLAAGIALAMLLASVPPGDDSAEASFARDMIAHHEAAIPMSQAVLERTDEPEVEQLARSIIAAQKTEIENMTSMVAKRVGDSAEVDLEPANGSGTKGTTTLSEAEGGGAKVVLDVSELPGRSSGRSRRSTRIRTATGRARRYCTRSRSKDCSRASPRTSTSTDPAPESPHR